MPEVGMIESSKVVTLAFAIESCTLELVRGDVTKQKTDAIGNAANALLLGGGGVDGAIHRAAGPDLLEALHVLKKTLPGGVLKTGGAVITPGFRLAAKHIVHCVGPIYAREGAEAPELLASCYREALALVRQHGLSSIAFPSIATGVYGYPVREAAEVAIRTIDEQLREHRSPGLVRFVLFDDATVDAYEAAARGRNLVQTG
jgi:O-acetyl-ADP-ribose deacetylase